MKYFFALLSALFMYSANAYTTLPQDGLWSLDSEKSLAIGRAFNIETGNSLTVVTFYNYNATGAPTFYVGAGGISASNVLSVGLSEPRGGTCLGCAPTTGSLLSSPGTAVFEFTSSTTGFVTLPRETRKAITKGNIGFEAAPGGLLGGWAFTYISGTSGTAFADYAALTNIVTGTASGSGLVINSTATIGCEYQVTGGLEGYVLCIKLTPGNLTDKQVLAKWYGHHMDGAWQYVGLTGGSIFTSRRILTAVNQYTVKREMNAPAETVDALRSAMQIAIDNTPRPVE